MNTPKTVEETVILAMGVGNWKRMHETSQQKLITALNELIRNERIDEVFKTTQALVKSGAISDGVASRTLVLRTARLRAEERLQK